MNVSTSMSKQDETTTVLIGTYTEPEASKSEGVHIYQMDLGTGELIFQKVITGLPNVSSMALHPHSGRIYAVSETELFNGQPGGGVIALSAGDFNVINKQNSGGVHPCYISIERTGRFALVANYSGGTVAMLPIHKNGQLEAASDVVQHAGSSIHPERQTSPHPHCIVPDPSNRFAVAVDLGMDTLMVYRMDLEAGTLHKHSEVPVEAGAGPRHLIFHSNGLFAYLLNELNSKIVVYQYAAENGSFMHLQTLTTLPADFAGENYCSDLRLSLDEKHLYVANRGHDNIVCFNVDAGGGELSYQSQASAHGHYPRILAPDPGGHFLLAAHQRSDSVTVFKIDPESGDLSYTGHKAQLDMPVHVLFA